MRMSGKIPQRPNISLYFHIPFCTHKCHYCHFYVIPDKAFYKTQLMEGLALEWQQRLPQMQNTQIESIYFGGGTPSLLGAERIAHILDTVKAALPFGAEPPEITLEANPENISTELMQSYAQAGINRVSIGVQTLDPPLLQMLSRQHTAHKAIDAVISTAQAGIGNISIDLMYDLPGQTLQSWQSTLERACTLPIAHLSLYNLTIEPHTPFYIRREALQKLMPDSDTSAQMHVMAIDTLLGHGWEHYEISAFSKNGCISRHNVGYWTSRPFLGFGPSAFSYWEGARFQNCSNLSKYLRALKVQKSPVDFTEELPLHAHQRELLAIQLRLRAGVDMTAFQQTHGPLESEVLQSIQGLIHSELLESSANSILRLTRRGMLLYDTVAVELI